MAFNWAQFLAHAATSIASGTTHMHMHIVHDSKSLSDATSGRL